MVPNQVLQKMIHYLKSLYEAFSGGTAKTQLVDENANAFNAQNPIPTNGDSVYAKDINESESDLGDFSGSVSDLFNDLTTVNTAQSVANGGTNPKSFTITLDRPISATTFALSSADSTISNVKITFKTISGVTMYVLDDSADSTKTNLKKIQIPQIYFTQAVVEFYTDDEVNLNGFIIFKSNNVNIDGIIGIRSDVNSSNTPLLAGQSFVGEVADTKNYGIIICSVYSNVASATNGLVIEFSSDQTNWYWNDTYTISAATGKTFSVQTQARYMRVRYTNGGTNQTTFDLETIIKPVYIKPSSHRVADSISSQDDAELVKAVLTGEKPDNEFVNFQATTQGNFKVSIEEYDDATTPYRTNIEGGGKIAVGTSPVEVTFTGTTKSIIITADIDNSGYLYVGKSNVTSAGANALTFLMPGDSLEISYDDSINALYVVGSAASQNFWKGAVL